VLVEKLFDPMKQRHRAPASESFCLACLSLLVAGLAAGCRMPARTPPPLVAGTSWRVVALKGRDAAAAAPTLVFESGERAAGSTGCNSYFATVEILGSGMSFGKVGSTRRGCPGAAAEQEKRFLDALANVRTHRLRGEFLELLSESGIVLIRLERSAAPTAGNPPALAAPNPPNASYR
jgi:heat shock protein HslJ